MTESYRTSDAESMYLDLMKKVLTRTDLDHTYRVLHTRVGTFRKVFNPLALKILDAFNLELRRRVDREVRLRGGDWPSEAETMIGLARLTNLQACLTDVLDNGVPGDVIETGVWRGGATIFMRAVLKVRNVTDRMVWVADSFQGLPKPDASRYPVDAGDVHWTNHALAVSVDEVMGNFKKYDLLDEQVRFLVGWFRDTLPSAPIDQLSVMRLDGDMYESTIVALEALYPRLSCGGYAIIDDYGAVSSCRRAVHDYRDRHKVMDEMKEIDWSGVFWQKTSQGSGDEM
ncbi:MAG: TylF/MycF/NovP-related O-methyltransferase [Candidatus Dormibacteraceae bacterium]